MNSCSCSVVPAASCVMPEHMTRLSVTIMFWLCEQCDDLQDLSFPRRSTTRNACALYCSSNMIHDGLFLEANEAPREATGASIHAWTHAHVDLQGYMSIKTPRLGALFQKPFHPKEQELSKAKKLCDCTHGTCKASHWDAMIKGCSKGCLIMSMSEAGICPQPQRAAEISLDTPCEEKATTKNNMLPLCKHHWKKTLHKMKTQTCCSLHPHVQVHV